MRRSTMLLVLLAIAACHGKKVRIGQSGEVFYKSPVTRQEAEKVGQLLESTGEFSGGGRKSLQLRKKDGVYLLRIVIIKGKENDAKIVNALKFTAGRVSHQALGGSKIKLQLCNAYFKTKRTLEVPPTLGDIGMPTRFGKGELYVKPPVEQSMAKRIGDSLLKRGFFSHKRTTSAAVSLKEGTYHLRLVVDQDRYGARMRKSIKSMCMGVAVDALDGAPLQAHFCNVQVEPFAALEPLQPGKKLAFGKGAVFYIAPVTAEDATSLGKRLEALQFFKVPRSVRLARKGKRFQLTFVVKADALVEPRALQALGELFEKTGWATGQVDLFTSDKFFLSATPLSRP